MALAWAAIVLYTILVPVLYLAMSRRAREAILFQQPTPLSRSLAFLHQDMQLSMYWWELAEIAKKTFLVGFCVLIRRGTIEQLLIAFAFCWAVLLVSSIISPFQHPVSDKAHILASPVPSRC